MSETARTFDCVRNMREARDKLSAEIEGMTHAEMLSWLRNRPYTDPVLRRLAEMAARQGAAAGDVSRRG